MSILKVIIDSIMAAVRHNSSRYCVPNIFLKESYRLIRRSSIKASITAAKIIITIVFKIIPSYIK